MPIIFLFIPRGIVKRPAQVFVTFPKNISIVLKSLNSFNPLWLLVIPLTIAADKDLPLA